MRASVSASLPLRPLSHQTLILRNSICHGCWHHLFPLILPRHRLYSSSVHSPNTNDSIKTGYAHLRTRRLISIRGPDSSHYLQGAVTASVPHATQRSTGFFAAFLNAQGRVLNDVFLYPDHTVSDDAWLIEVDAAEAETLLKHIKRYKLRAKFDVRLLDESEMRVWSMWQTRSGGFNVGGSASWTAYTIGETDRPASTYIGCEDSRALGMGRRLILPGSKTPEIADTMEESTEEIYRIRRYLKGVAEGQTEILRGSALPQESNLDFMGGIDYRKGCYVGQELTIRTHHTGVIRKRILPLMLYGPEDKMPKETPEYRPDSKLEGPAAGTSIVRLDNMGRSAGKWLAGVGNIGLGLCRVEIMANMVVQGEVRGYKEGDEFKMEWSNEQGNTNMVNVKAFVPRWHRMRQK